MLRGLSRSVRVFRSTNAFKSRTQSRFQCTMASTDEEDDDLGRAIALSLQDATPSPPRARGLLGLDRAAMERERLGGKRKAQSKSLDTVEPTHSKRSRVEEGPPQDKPPQDLPFPKGAVRKTWVRGFPRVPNEDIKIEEVLQRSDLQLAVLSSFIWDMDWLFSKINMARTKIVLVMEAKEETTKTMYRQQTAQMKNLRICFPPMPPNVNIMHSKLMLLSFPAYLRVVVPTANLVHFDWGENGVMENSIFLIDLPRLPSSQRPGNEQSDESRLLPFAQELIAFCRAQGLDESIIKSLQNFDFSATEKYAFIHSIGGAHTGKDEPWRRTGYCGLGRAVSRLGLVPQAKAKPMGLGESHTPLRLDFVSSSVGSLNNEFLSALYLAAMGDDGTTELMWRNAQAAKQLKVTRKQPMSKEALLRSVGRDLKVYFPSDQTVKSSLGGYDNAGTVCFQPQFFNSTKFPRQSLLDCRSTRTGLLMHNKVNTTKYSLHFKEE